MKAPMSNRVKELLSTEEGTGYLLEKIRQHKQRVRSQREQGRRKAIETDTEKITGALRKVSLRNTSVRTRIR